MVRAESGIAPSHIMYLARGGLYAVAGAGLRSRPCGPSGGALAGGGARGWAVPVVPVASGQLTAGSRTRLHVRTCEVSVVVSYSLVYVSTRAYAPVKRSSQLSGREARMRTPYSVLHEQLSRRSVPADPSAFTLNSALSLIRQVDTAHSRVTSMVTSIVHRPERRPWTSSMLCKVDPRHGKRPGAPRRVD